MRLEQLEVLAELGRGGMGVVWRARDRVTGREVAVKQVLVDDPEARARFAQEVAALGRLRHPNLVQVHASGLDPRGLPYLIMELVPGVSLSKKLEEGALAPRAAAQLIAGAARGIAHAHERGILHRDLKPQNLLLDAATGQAKVLDFGLAVATASAERLTKTGAVLGTPAYMAPEQLGDAKRAVDARTDVYGLGATLYQALTARPPFEGQEAAQIMVKVLRGPPPSPRDSSADVPEPLDAICLKALASDASDRYSSADELACDLERWLRGEPTVARPLTAAQKRRLRWRRRRGPLVAGALTVVTLCLAAAGLGAWRTTAAAEGLLEWRRALAEQLDERELRARTSEELERLVERARRAPVTLDEDPSLLVVSPPGTLRALAEARAQARLVRARAGADAAVRPGEVARRLELARDALADLARVASAVAPGGLAAKVGERLTAREQAALLHLAAGRRPEALEALAITDALPAAIVLAEALAAPGPDGQARLAEALRLVEPLDDPRALALRLRGPDPLPAEQALLRLVPPSLAPLGERLAACRTPAADAARREAARTDPELARRLLEPRERDPATRALGPWRRSVKAAPEARLPLARLALALDRPLLARVIAGEPAEGDAPLGGDLAVVRARAVWTWPLGLVPRAERLRLDAGGALAEAAPALDGPRVATRARLEEVEAAALAGLRAALRDPTTTLCGLRDACLLLERLPATAIAPPPPLDAGAQAALDRTRAALVDPADPGPPAPSAAAVAPRVARLLALVARSEREVEAWQRVEGPDALDRAVALSPVEAEHRADDPAGRDDVAWLRASLGALRALAARLLARAGLPAGPPAEPVPPEPPAALAAWSDVGRVRARQSSPALIEPVRRHLLPAGEACAAAATSLVAAWLDRLAAEEAGIEARGRLGGGLPSLVAVGRGPGETGASVGPAQQAALEALRAALAARGSSATIAGHPLAEEARGADVVLLPVADLPAEGASLQVVQRLRVRQQLQSGYGSVRYQRLAAAVEDCYRRAGVVAGPDGDPIPRSPSGDLARGHRDYWGSFGRRIGAEASPEVIRSLLRSMACGHYIRESVSSVVADRWCALPCLDEVEATPGDDAEAPLMRCHARLLAVARCAGSEMEGRSVDLAALETTRRRLDAAIADGERASSLRLDHPGAVCLAAAARMARITETVDEPEDDWEADRTIEALDLVACAYLPIDTQIPIVVLLPSAYVALGERRQALSAAMLALRSASWLTSRWAMWRESIETVFPLARNVTPLVEAVTRARKVGKQ